MLSSEKGPSFHCSTGVSRPCGMTVGPHSRCFSKYRDTIKEQYPNQDDGALDGALKWFMLKQWISPAKYESLSYTKLNEDLIGTGLCGCMKGSLLSPVSPRTVERLPSSFIMVAV